MGALKTFSWISNLNKLNKTLIISRNLRTVRATTGPLKSLEQRLAELELNAKDQELDAQVEIGLPVIKPSKKLLVKERIKIIKHIKNDQALFEAAKTRKLRVDLDKVREELNKSGGGEIIRQAALHYGVFKDLFQHGIFTPTVMLDISYEYDEESVTPVYRGNIIMPSEASAVPYVDFHSKPDELWTLVLTNPDAHLSETNAEYLHWFIANIRGNDIKTGEEIFSYLQPIPVKGAGYQRMIFTLYKQEKLIEYSNIQKPSHKYNLESRTFNTYKFYSQWQDLITPAGLAFFQSAWEESLVDFFHQKLQMHMPVYEYSREKKFVKPQIKYPHKKSFNLYLDKYRDIHDIRKEVLLKRLQMISPFEEEPPPPKYPNIYKTPENLASWQKADLWKQRNRIGKYRDLRPYSSYQDEEFDFDKVWNTSVDTAINKKD